MNCQKPLYVEVHALQTLPPNNINRDELGRPKTAEYGGVTRARISSQAWKKAMRDYFRDELSLSMGVRTKWPFKLLAERICDLDDYVDAEESLDTAITILHFAGITGKQKDNEYETDALFFISSDQVDELAQLGRKYLVEKQEWETDKDKLKAGEARYKKEAKGILQNSSLNAVDLALFGRMIAEQKDLDVDAAAQVAPAVGVDRNQIEYDFFTALDDYAGKVRMMDTIQYSSSTVYRYANINVARLLDNIGGDLDRAINAVQGFLKAFIMSSPTGKVNSFGNPPLPSAVIIQLRSSQPVSLAAAFERPVFARDPKTESVTEIACRRLVAQEEALDKSFGVTPERTFVICTTEATNPLKKLAGEVLTLEETQQRVEEELKKWGGQ